MPRIVVLGTGTGVGKTHVSATLASELARYTPTLALKPVETGTTPAWPGGPTSANPHPASDAARLSAAAGTHVPAAHPLYAFADPISPHLAAARAATTIQIAAIITWIHTIENHVRTETHLSPCSLIETAGGALSPLAPGVTNADLTRELKPDLILLVAPDALGVLHDVTATLIALTTLSCPTPLVVLTASRPPDHSTGTNAPELRSLGVATTARAIATNDVQTLRDLARDLLTRLFPTGLPRPR